MATDFGNNMYTPSSDQCYNSSDNMYPPPILPNQNQLVDNMDFTNAQSLADVPHKQIKQLSPNEYFIPYGSGRWQICLFILVAAFFFVTCILIQIYASEDNKSTIGVYIGIVFSGFLLSLGLYGFFGQTINLTIILEDNGIRLVRQYNCGCKKSSIIRKEEISRFETELRERSSNKSILYYDKDQIKKYIITLDFFEKEADYLVYVLNKHLNIQVPSNTYGTPMYSNF